jgi:uncharacterized protein (DUF736 family)
MSEEKEEKTDSVWKKNEIGALWRHDGRNQKYLSGHITIGEMGEEQRFKVLVFTNKDKDKHENAPDFRVYVNPERDQSEAPKEEGGSSSTDSSSTDSSSTDSNEIPEGL